MILSWYGLFVGGGLFGCMLLLLEIGRRIGLRRLKQDPENARQGVGVIEGAVFGLLGLLIAFTFSGASSRFDARRELIIEEANDIRTAWRRLDLLPAEEKARLQDLFRQYLDSRLETYREFPDFTAARAELAHSLNLQDEIWTNAVVASRNRVMDSTHTSLLSALEQMTDITAKRVQATETHEPTLVFAVLGLVSLASSLLAGYGMAGGSKRNWMHMIGFAAIVALTVYAILELEFPRLGFVNLHTADSVLIDLRKSMQ